jgi:hypothetical protein
MIYTHTFLMGREAIYMEADMGASIILSLLAYGLLAHSAVKEKTEFEHGPCPIPQVLFK